MRGKSFSILICLVVAYTLVVINVLRVCRFRRVRRVWVQDFSPIEANAVVIYSVPWVCCRAYEKFVNCSCCSYAKGTQVLACEAYLNRIF